MDPALATETFPWTIFPKSFLRSDIELNNVPCPCWPFHSDKPFVIDLWYSCRLVLGRFIMGVLHHSLLLELPFDPA